MESASTPIDEKIRQLDDWRGKTLAKVRGIIHDADPEIVEESKWMGTPVFSHGGIVCTGETYKNVVKMTTILALAARGYTATKVSPNGEFLSAVGMNATVQ